MIEASVLANLRPSDVVLAIQAGLLQTYSQPIIKNGFSRS